MLIAIQLFLLIDLILLSVILLSFCTGNVEMKLPAIIVRALNEYIRKSQKTNPDAK